MTRAMTPRTVIQVDLETYATAGLSRQTEKTVGGLELSLPGMSDMYWFLHAGEGHQSLIDKILIPS